MRHISHQVGYMSIAKFVTLDYFTDGREEFLGWNLTRQRSEFGKGDASLHVLRQRSGRHPGRRPRAVVDLLGAARDQPQHEEVVWFRVHRHPVALRPLDLDVD